jgi:quinol monooxygenase YgiN
MADVSDAEFRIVCASQIRAKRVSTKLPTNASTPRIPKPAAWRRKRCLSVSGSALGRLRAIRTKFTRSFAATTIAVASSQLRGRTTMAKYALYAELKAKPGKEAEVEAFLKQGAEMVNSETGTVDWYGFKEDKPGVFGIFDTFDDEAGREAHLNGEIAKALMAKADEYFAEKPVIHKITLIAEK